MLVHVLGLEGKCHVHMYKLKFGMSMHNIWRCVLWKRHIVPKYDPVEPQISMSLFRDALFLATNLS